MLRVPSPAKVNLFLHITGRRENGYHELQTIFQLIDLYDYLSFYPNGHQEIYIQGLEHVDLTDNLIYRAAQALRPFAQHFTGYDIQLEKNIPMGAGLGGGSSNAATTLLVLNQLWQCRRSINELMQIGAKLGADVPIFVFGQNAWAEGIGEIITATPKLPQKRFIILKPDCFISTQELFSQKTLTRDSKPSKFCAYLQTPSNFGNNFEPVARKLYPAVEEAFQYLNQYGQAKLTGTGACVFIEIDLDIDTNEIKNNAPCAVFEANSLKISPVFEHLKSL